MDLDDTVKQQPDDAGGGSPRNQDNEFRLLQEIAKFVRQDAYSVPGKGKNKREPENRPITDGVLRYHLGGNAVGVFLTAPGSDKTYFGVLDGDNHPDENGNLPLTRQEVNAIGQKLHKAVLEKEHGVHLYIFRSGGGEGFHAWAQFETPQLISGVRGKLQRILADIGFSEGDDGLAAKQMEIRPSRGKVAKGHYGMAINLPFAGLSVALSPTMVGVGVLNWPLSKWLYSAPVPPDMKEISSGQYLVKYGCIKMRTQNSVITVCKFDARINECTTVDDGSGIQTKTFRIAGTLEDSAPLPTIEILADKFTKGDWWTAAWGGQAKINNHTQEKIVGHAVLELSGDIPQRTIYAHTGWRKIDGVLVYLHGGGAVSDNGPLADVECQPGGALNRYVLPPAVDVDAAMRESLRLLDLGIIGYVAFATIYRAPLCEFFPSDITILFTGTSGLFKSGVAAIVMNHYGKEFRYHILPETWSSTGMALLQRAFAAKDAVLVIDDKAPKKTESSRREQEDKTDMLTRNQGNLAGRSRLNRDATLMPALHWPRGIILSTGEDVPSGLSLRARMVIVPFTPDCITRAQVVTFNKAGHSGLLAQAMTGYVQWLARAAVDDLSTKLAERHEALVEVGFGNLSDDQGKDEVHARTPPNIAHMQLGLEYGLRFAVAVGALDEEAALQKLSGGEQLFKELSIAQTGAIATEREENRLLGTLRTVLEGGHAHLLTRGGVEAPHGRELMCGWRVVAMSNGDAGQPSGPIWGTCGPRIGWFEEKSGSEPMMFLDPEATMIAVQRLAKDQYKPFSLDYEAMGPRLRDAQLLAKAGSGHVGIQRRFTGKQERYWMIRMVTVFPDIGEVEM